MSQIEFYSICRSSAIHNVIGKMCLSIFRYDSGHVLTILFCVFVCRLIVLNVALPHHLKSRRTQLGKRGKKRHLDSSS